MPQKNACRPFQAGKGGFMGSSIFEDLNLDADQTLHELVRERDQVDNTVILPWLTRCCDAEQAPTHLPVGMDAKSMSHLARPSNFNLFRCQPYAEHCRGASIDVDDGNDYLQQSLYDDSDSQSNSMECRVSSPDMVRQLILMYECHYVCVAPVFQLIQCFQREAGMAPTSNFYKTHYHRQWLNFVKTFKESQIHPMGDEALLQHISALSTPSACVSEFSAAALAWQAKSSGSIAPAYTGVLTAAGRPARTVPPGMTTSVMMKHSYAWDYRRRVVLETNESKTLAAASNTELLQVHIDASMFCVCMCVRQSVTRLYSVTSENRCCVVLTLMSHVWFQLLDNFGVEDALPYLIDHGRFFLHLCACQHSGALFREH